jgi:signal transduction histidine kinase
VADTALGISRIVDETMAAATRMHLAEKGRDPRRYTLVAFGGAGPVHACNLARLLKMKRVLVPLGAGVASALGFLVAPPATDAVRSLVGRLERLDYAAINALYAEMRAECEALLEIFAALLRIAQAESGARRAGFGRVDHAAVAATVAEVHAPAAEARGQVLEMQVAPGVAGFGDRDLITQALSNLLDNAVKHGREGGRVSLGLAAAPGGGAVLTVGDDGPGIPAESRELVLRRFHRLDSARATPGTGLGLALVAAVAELHGARLTLGDRAPGLLVTLALPGAPAEPV